MLRYKGKPALENLRGLAIDSRETKNAKFYSPLKGADCGAAICFTQEEFMICELP
jgi:hypothetical protein